MAAKLRRYDRLLALSLVCRPAIHGLAATNFSGGRFDKLIFAFMREPMSKQRYAKLHELAREIMPNADDISADFANTVPRLEAILRSMYGDDQA